MATAPKLPVELEANDLETIVSIRVDQIDAGDRLRPIDPVWADALGAIMAREGQQMPIEVCRLPGRDMWTLVTGAHRHHGAALHDIEYLKAIIVGADRAERRRREVMENLFRNDLEPVDRAAFIAELVALKKQQKGIETSKDGRAASAAVRWQKAVSDEADDAKLTLSRAYGWTDEVAGEIGVSSATIKRDMMLFRRLSPSAVDRLRSKKHPAATNNSQLHALAKLEHAEQSKVVDRLLHVEAALGNGPKTVGEAIAAISGKVAPPPDAKRLNAFLGAFGRMSLSERRGALQTLQPQIPAPLKLVNEAGRTTPDEKYLAEVRDGLRAAFDLIMKFSDGEPVDDDEINAARVKTQTALMALMAVNAGALPTPGAAK